MLKKWSKWPKIDDQWAKNDKKVKKVAYNYLKNGEKKTRKWSKMGKSRQKFKKQNVVKNG